MKTRKIISTLISVIMLMQILITGTFTVNAQTTIENLATPTNISYLDNTIAWTHNKENIKTFRVNFYALSTDGEYFHLQSNYDGDLKTNTSFSLYDELWAHFNECMETFELNPETTDILANVEALSNNEELYRSSGVSDWVSLKSRTTYPPLGNDSDIPTNPTTEVLDWCGAYLGKAEYSKVQGCINYETILYKDGVRIDTFRTTWYDGQRNSVIRNLSEKMTESGVYYFVGRACDSQWNIVAETKSNNYVYTNGQLIAPQNLHVENGILKWKNSPSTECTGYKLEVWYSNNNIAGTKLGTENITGDVVIKELFERYDFDSMSSKTYAFTENLNVRVIAYSDNPSYQDSPSDYYIIEPIAVGTTDSRASYRIYWNNKLSIQGSRNYGGDISDNFLSGTLSEYSSDIKTVSINDYINSIGEKAFYNADNLEKLDVNYGVSTFGKEAFAECDNLSSVNFSWSGQQSVSFEEKVFYNCDKLESITLPQYTMKISPYMFAECGALETIDMQDYVYYIEEGAFENCSNLTGVVFSDTLQRVEKNAFKGCCALTTATLPERVNTIGDGAFNCDNLNIIYIYNENAEIFDSADTLKCSVIYGYPNSTAQNYADKYGIDFRSLDADFIINDGAETTSDKNVSIKFNDYAMDNYSKYKINGGEYADITANTVAYTLDGEDGEKTVEITFSDGTNEKTITHTITLSTESTTGGNVSTDEDITYEGVKEIGGINDIITAEDTEYVNIPGNTLEIKVSVEPTSTNTNISTAITNNYSQYTTSQMFNIDINKIKTGAENSTTPITETSSLLSVNVEIPSTINGKDEYIVLREHNNMVDALKTVPNADGEYITVSDNAITIYAKKFSTYMIIAKDISYTPSRGGGGGGISKYTVKFETNGGSTVKSQSVSRNTVAKEPENPTREGFSFEGWYTDKELTVKFDFATKIAKSTTLYAKWKETPEFTLVLTIGQKEALINGVSKSNDVAPVIVNERTMLPIRFIAEELGAKVDWEQETQTVKVDFEDIIITVVIGQDKAFVNGEEIQLDATAFVENDRTYLPIRFIMENLGADVEWDKDNQQVIITK